MAKKKPGQHDYKLGDPVTGKATEREIEIIKRCAGIGMPMTRIGYILGVSPHTWIEYRKRNPEVDEAYHAGAAEEELQIGAALVRNARRGDLGSIKWWEATRTQRSEKQEITHTSKTYVIEAPAPMSLEDWEQANSPKDDVGPIENPQ